jgi:hypothetical protein
MIQTKPDFINFSREYSVDACKNLCMTSPDTYAYGRMYFLC